jgi:hypothetical protein
LQGSLAGGGAAALGTVTEIARTRGNVFVMPRMISVLCSVPPPARNDAPRAALGPLRSVVAFLEGPDPSSGVVGLRRNRGTVRGNRGVGSVADADPNGLWSRCCDRDSSPIQPEFASRIDHEQSCAPSAPAGGSRKSAIWPLEGKA